MKLEVEYPDVERAMRDLLADLVAPHEPDVTVGVGVPDGWDPLTSDPHLQVACDGTPSQVHPIVAHHTVRVVAWAASPTEAKALAALAQGLLLGVGAQQPIAALLPLTGLLPARDPDTRAELASFTVRATTRSQAIPPP